MYLLLEKVCGIQTLAFEFIDEHEAFISFCSWSDYIYLLPGEAIFDELSVNGLKN